MPRELNRGHAILGASPLCLATHPSDMCVALSALDATILVEGPRGVRSIPFSEFHRLPGESPERDTTLEPGEIILAVDLPLLPPLMGYSYLKIRAFALVSVAVLIKIDDGIIQQAHLSLGSVAPKAWG